MHKHIKKQWITLNGFNAKYFQTLSGRNGDILPTVCVAC